MVRVCRCRELRQERETEMDMQFKAGDIVTYTDGRRATVTGYVSEVTRHVALTDDTGLTFTAGESELRRALWTRDQISAALNAGADMVLDDDDLFGMETSDSIRMRSLIDLVVNAIGTVLDDPDVTLDDVILASYQPTVYDDDGSEISPGDPGYDAAAVTEVRGWVD